MITSVSLILILLPAFPRKALHSPTLCSDFRDEEAFSKGTLN